MFEAYKIGVAISLTNHVSPVLATIASDFAKTSKDAAAFEKRIESIRLGLITGLGAIGAGVALVSMFKSPIQHALEFERAMLRIKNIGGIDSGTLASVRSEALSGKYKGIDATESVNLFRDLHAAFGSAEHAKEFMPKFAAMARVTQGSYGKSALAGEEDVKALAKFAERRGGTASPKAMESALDTAMKIQNASAGAVTPKDLLAFTARMGAMGNQMSDMGIMKMWALMQEQGGSKAGTALNSAMQNLVNGRGTEKAGFWLHELGLVDEKANAAMLRKIYGDKAGQHKNAVTANSLVNSDGAREDTVGWVEETALPRILDYVHKQGITDEKKVNAKVSELLSMALSNRLGADSIALIATQLPRILKDYNFASDSNGLAGSVKEYDKSPMAKMQDLSAKWETALVHLGIAALPTIIPLVESLSESIENFSKYANENKGTVEAITGSILRLSIAMVGLGSFRVLIYGIKAVQMTMDVLKSSAGGSAQPIGMASKALGILGKAASVAQAAFIGWELGTWLNETFIAGTKFSDWLGKMIAKFLGWIGIKEAQDAYNANEKPNSPLAVLQAQRENMMLANSGLPMAYRLGNVPSITQKAVDQSSKNSVPAGNSTSSVAVKVADASQKSAPIVVQPPPPAPITLTSILNLDGKKIAESTTKYQTKALSGPQSGATQFDGSFNPRWLSNAMNGG